MFRQALGAALSLAVVLTGATAVQASDWVEDDGRPVFQATPNAGSPMPPTAPPPPEHLAQGGFLTGSASAVRRVPLGAMTPRYSEAAANLGSDADRFLEGAVKNEVVRPELMRGWIERTHPEFTAQVQNNPDAVVEIKGAWDNAGQILNAMGIRFHKVKGKEILDVPLQNTRVIVIDCEGKIPREAWEPIRQWVIRGGYLISTDWTLENFVEKAFPGLIAFNGEKTEGKTVDALVVQRDPARFAGTNVLRSTWKLDEESQEVRVLRPDLVRVLARSYKLGLTDPNRESQQDPNLWGVLACEFPYGRGRVLHLVGHFDYNSPMGFRQYVLPDVIPGAGVGLRQAIATNFLLEGLEKKR